ncbi:MAG TPA: thermonuclease family protein [Rhizomicrobium sp.]|nr:thermonuclease family protein [Rhizomicrobium sp.]
MPGDACAASAQDTHYIPDCAGVMEIKEARALRVEKDGALILPDGRILVLEGIRLAPGEQGMAALRKLVFAGPITFSVTPPKGDRYGRIRVQAFGKEWLQMTLLEQGAARVQIAPDRQECAPDFYEGEARARARHAGLWALVENRVRTPDDLKGTLGSFHLVEGRVSDVVRADGRIFLEFEGKVRRGFSVVIEPEDRRAFRDFDFDSLSGRHIRVRGIVQDYRGRPQIVLSNPAQVEMIDP